jgi:ABC-type transporter Mla subunit MlaD
VASKPSEITELLGDVNEVLSMIKSMDLEGISDRIKTTLDKANQTLDDAQVKEISGNLNSLLEKAARSLQSADETLLSIKGAVTTNEEAFSRAITDLEIAMRNAHVFFRKGTSLIHGADATLQHFERQFVLISQDLERATGNLNQLLELLGDQPSQLLFGQPPVPRKVEPEAGKR